MPRHVHQVSTVYKMSCHIATCAGDGSLGRVRNTLTYRTCVISQLCELVEARRFLSLCNQGVKHCNNIDFVARQHYISLTRLFYSVCFIICRIFKKNCLGAQIGKCCFVWRRNVLSVTVWETAISVKHRLQCQMAISLSTPRV